MHTIAVLFSLFAAGLTSLGLWALIGGALTGMFLSWQTVKVVWMLVKWAYRQVRIAWTVYLDTLEARKAVATVAPLPPFTGTPVDIPGLAR